MAMAEVARAEAHCGVSTAAAHFEQAIKTAHERDDSLSLSFLGPSPRNSALTLVGQRMTEAGLLEQALGLIQELEKETEDEWLASRASLLGTVAVRGARLGTLDRHRVEALFAQALAIAGRIPTTVLGPPWQLIALGQIAKQLAESGRYRSAFNTISLAHFTLDPFMIGVSEWADTLEELEKGMSLAVIAAMTRIFGWQRADWKILAEQLA
jgi:hypothetical protein